MFRFDIGNVRTLPLLYADVSFSLIHVRLIFAFMTQTLWPQLIQECVRVLRPGGILILTENDAQCWTTSDALAELYRLGHQALYSNRNSWARKHVGIVVSLPRLMQARTAIIFSSENNDNNIPSRRNLAASVSCS